MGDDPQLFTSAVHIHVTRYSGKYTVVGCAPEAHTPIRLCDADGRPLEIADSHNPGSAQTEPSVSHVGRGYFASSFFRVASMPDAFCLGTLNSSNALALAVPT